MSKIHDKKRILVIDRQTSWCELSAQVLHEAGFSVEKRRDYHQPVSQVSTPDLVLLGCMQVGSTEQELIAALLKEHYHLLVLSTSISKMVMCSLYQQGVDDVLDKPYNPTTLLNIVSRAFDYIATFENFVSR